MQILRWGLLISFTVFLLACAGPQAVQKPGVKTSPAAVATKPPKATVRAPQTVVATARSVLGVPYRYGGTSIHGFDCSGLVNYAYRSAGITVPRSSSEQFRQSRRVPLQNLQAGDLLFFRLRPPKVSHVAIYDSNGRFIHAPSSGKQVSYGSLDNPYWHKHLVAAGRF